MRNIVYYAKALLKELTPMSVEDIIMLTSRNVIGGPPVNYPRVIHVPGMITLSMPTSRDTTSTSRSSITLTMTTQELAPIDLAAKLAGKSRAKFIIDAAVAEAEKVLAMQPTPKEK